MRKGRWLGLLGLVGLAGLAASSARAAGPTRRSPYPDPVEVPTDEQARDVLCWAVPRVSGGLNPQDPAQSRRILAAASRELWGVALIDVVDGDHSSVQAGVSALRRALQTMLEEVAAGRDPCPIELDPVEISDVAPMGGRLGAVGDPPRGGRLGAVGDPPAGARLGAVGDPPGQVVDRLLAQYPQGGAFYQVVRGDRLLGTGQDSIVYRWLASDAYRAAIAAGQTADEARATARRLAGNNRLRVAAYELLGCVPWNDANYGTYQVSRLSFPLFPTGRAFTMLPIHARNLDRIRRGDPPLRTITLGSPGQQGDFVATSQFPDEPRGFALFWLPLLDGPALLAGRVELDPTPWGDGSSRIYPPPEIQALDQLFVADLQRTTFGCGGYAVTYGA